MNREAEIVEQTRIRRALLAQGYTPLANKDKMCILKGWSTIEVDEALIEEWSGAYKYRATGVRLDNRLCMLDFDINDEALLQQIIDEMPADLWEILESAPVRLGSGFKEGWFVRTDREFVRWASAAFYRPGEAGDAPLHRLECFANSGRQAGAFGAHSINADGAVKTYYRWPTVSLTDVALADLPLLTVEQVDRLCVHVNDVMTAAGWHPRLNLKKGETTEPEVFDLHDAMYFDTDDGHMTLNELTKAVQGGSLRLSASWLEGASAVNRSRCIATARHDGGLQIFETADCQIHRPINAQVVRDREGLSEKMARLQALVDGGGGLFTPTGRSEAEVVGSDGAEEEMEDLTEAVVAALLQEYAACPTDAKTPIYPLDGTKPMSVANFKLKMRPFSLKTQSKTGKITVTNPVDLWLDHADRLEVVGYDYRPDKPGERLVWDGSRRGEVINRYAPEPHEPGGDVAVHLALWRAFLAHLVPDPTERAWLVNKLAAKAQRPWLPGVVTLLVAPLQGTGRGTLFSVLEGLFGRRNCITLDRNKLFGRDGQGQYTDWRAGRLLGFVHELLAGESGGGFHNKRQEMYEHLKVVGDPAAQTFDVVEKYESTRDAVAHVSLFIATNHLNALPIQSGDRRIAVITGGGMKLDDDPYLRTMHTEKLSADFLSAVWYDLTGAAVDWDKVMQAPLFAGRDTMIAENTSDLDTIIAEVLERVPGDYVTIGALRDRVNRRLQSAGMADERAWQLRMSNMLAAQDNPTGWVFLRKRYKVVAPGAAATDGAGLKWQVVARGGRGHMAFEALGVRARFSACRAENPHAEVSAALERARALDLRIVPPKT